MTLPGAIPGHSELPPLATRLHCTHMTTEWTHRCTGLGCHRPPTCRSHFKLLRNKILKKIIKADRVQLNDLVFMVIMWLVCCSCGWAVHYGSIGSELRGLRVECSDPWPCHFSLCRLCVCAHTASKDARFCLQVCIQDTPIADNYFHVMAYIRILYYYV